MSQEIDLHILDESLIPQFSEKNPRFLRETGTEAKIVHLILPVIEDLGYQIVRVKLLYHNHLTLQIMAERFDHSMTIEDCEILNNVISPLLDSEDLILDRYHLEISSPGIDRPLVRIEDFKTWQDYFVKIETHIPIEGNKKYRGIIIDSDDKNFILKVEATEKNNEKKLEIPYDSLLSAHLILTNKLIRDTLKKNKNT